MNVEVRATRLKVVRMEKGVTQRQLAKDLGLSQNYIPALEAGTRKPGADIRGRLIKYFGCNFQELFEVVLVDPETRSEKVLEPATRAR